MSTAVTRVPSAGGRSIGPRLLSTLVAACLLLIAVACVGDSNDGPAATPLRIGLLLDFTGSPQASADRQRAFDLAIRHVNEAGGVLGRPVESAVADATRDPAAAVEAARRLVEVEGVHAIVGPNSSAAALPVARSVSGPLRVPTISPSATSPELTGVEDGGYFFRTALSDAAQGPILASVTRGLGFENIGVIYQDDPYGRGLSAAFEASWDGTLRAVSIDPNETSYLPALEESAAAGAQALLLVVFEGHALALVRAALDAGIYDRFVFADAAKRIGIVREIGGDRLGGMYGTASAAAPDNAATADWEAAFIAEYGALPVLAYVKETYDAAIALALAAQAAGSVDGEAVRDRLVQIAGPPGRTVLATPAGVAEGLSLLARGGEIDFDGAASTLDWDENGDLRRGHIGTWRFTPDGRIEELDTVAYDGGP